MRASIDVVLVVCFFGCFFAWRRGDFNGLECAGGCGLVFWGSRWHSRFGLVLSATLGGLLAFGLASALRCLLRKLFGLLVLSLASAIC
jgi:hypothetical protein